MSPPPPTDPEPTGLDAVIQKFADGRVRTLLFAGLGGLAMLFVVMFERGADIGGVLVVALGLAGFALGWRGPPAFILLILLYFLVFPFGTPPPEEDPFELAEGHFRIADILLAASVVVYLSAHYRLHGLTTQAMPADEPGGAKKVPPRRRPTELVRRGEVARMLYMTGAAVLTGQIVWAVVANVEVDVLADFPFRFAEGSPLTRRESGDLAPWRTRLVATAGLVVFGALLARLVFGYWRLRVMSPPEGAMLLLDAGWDETKRERVRVEGWRMWGVKQVAARARAWRPGRGGKR
jgi:hypothetical protein